jgi:tRNA (adenine37-N6)-methyltransferase
MDFTFSAIGVIHSCFKEKFGIPRQPGLAPLAQATLELLPPYNDPAALEGLEASSHIWIQFVFHANRRKTPGESTWKPKVKAPRLGGNKTLGVFATRSPMRPVPIGLSVVKLDAIELAHGKSLLHLSGIDLLDGTPVLDIKPYVPYVDLVANATNAFAPTPPIPIPVNIGIEQLTFCAEYRHQTGIELASLIRQILEQDPRPAYQELDENRVYGMKLFDMNLRWRYTISDAKLQIHVESILPRLAF